MHVNKISILPPPHIFVKTISQVPISPRMIATMPTKFNGIPKPYCYYNMTESLNGHELEQCLFVMPVLKIFGQKLSL